MLATLLINAGQIVPADVLINEVWGDSPPNKAGNLISIYVLRLRRLMADADSSVLVTRAPGYQLRIAAGDSDAQLFETLVDDGRRALAAGDPATAASQLAEALALWRGSPLADVPATPLVEAAAERLEDLRLDAGELRITAELDCGNHAQVIPELRRLLADHSLRENLWLLLMRALDGAGLHAEALDAYGQARTAISEELGVDPGRELRQAYAGMLAKDTTDAPGSISAGTVAASAKPAEPIPRAGRVRGPTCRPSCPPTWPTSPAAATRSGTCATCWPARARMTIPARSTSRWSPGQAGWVRPPWPCTRRTGSGQASPTASCTWTCSARPRIRCCPRTCWPGSCATWAWPAATYRPTRTSARPATVRSWPGAGSWSCSTTPRTRPRSGRCCRAPRPARYWSPPAAACRTWPAPSWSTSTCSTTTRRWPCSPRWSGTSG